MALSGFMDRVAFAVSTLHRWYYRARRAKDPMAILKDRLCGEVGRFPSLTPLVIETLTTQCREHQSWTAQLHFDNLHAALKGGDTKIASYTTIRRYLKAQGMLSRAKPKCTTADELAGRRYLCASCYTEVLICSPCDRGNRYCSGDCAEKARAASMKLAGQRYQKSLAGSHKHAERQRRYRDKQTKEMHQGSPRQPFSDLLSVIPMPQLVIASPLPWHCHFCSQSQSQFVRNDFLRRRIRRP